MPNSATRAQESLPLDPILLDFGHMLRTMGNPAEADTLADADQSYRRVRLLQGHAFDKSTSQNTFDGIVRKAYTPTQASFSLSALCLLKLEGRQAR